MPSSRVHGGTSASAAAVALEKPRCPPDPWLTCGLQCCKTVFTGVRASSQLRLATWFSMVDGLAGVVLGELACACMQCWNLEAALRCTAVLPDAVGTGQQPQAASPLSPSPWLTAAAIAIVSSDTTAHASCFHEGLLRITLCSPNSCCWSLSSSGPIKGGHMSWNTTTSAAC